MAGDRWRRQMASAADNAAAVRMAARTDAPLTPNRRLLMLALEQPALGPATLARFPHRLRAAVREVLCIAAHGTGVQVGCC